MHRERQRKRNHNDFQRYHIQSFIFEKAEFVGFHYAYCFMVFLFWVTDGGHCYLLNALDF